MNNNALVFCSECRHYKCKESGGGSGFMPECAAGQDVVPVVNYHSRKVVATPWRPYIKNENNDCADFSAKLSWWRRWWVQV